MVALARRERYIDGEVGLATGPFSPGPTPEVYLPLGSFFAPIMTAQKGSLMMTAFERDAILADLIATGGPWDPAATFLGVADSIDDRGLATAVADIHAPPTSLAVRQAVTTWSTPHVKSDGRAMVDSPSRRFSPASSADGTVIGAYYVADALTAGNLMFFKGIPGGIPLPDNTASMTIVLRLVVDPVNGTWEASIVFNG